LAPVKVVSRSRTKETACFLVRRERAHYQIPEVGDGPWSDPQGDRSFSVRSRFDVVDDQRRLFVMDIE